MKAIIRRFIEKTRLLKKFKDNNQILILNYHRLRDLHRVNLFDDGVFGPDAARFETEMQWLKNETQVLSEEELLDIVYNKKKLKHVCSMVTFDDAYIDNYDIAYPILKKHSIPAIYFVPTKHITERTLGWWDITAYLIKQTQLSSVQFREKNWNLRYKQHIISELIGELKTMEPSRVENYLKELSTAVEVSMPSIEVQGKELMSWAQIKELSQSSNKITIGSHTHEHVVLSRQALPDLSRQIKKSKDILEDNLGINIQSIAYPVGGYDHFDLETKRVAQSLGFKLGFSFLTGINRYEQIDPYDLRRACSQSYWLNLDLALAFPERVFQRVRT